MSNRPQTLAEMGLAATPEQELMHKEFLFCCPCYPRCASLTEDGKPCPHYIPGKRDFCKKGKRIFKETYGD